MKPTTKIPDIQHARVEIPQITPRRLHIFISQDYSFDPKHAANDAKMYSRFVMDKGFVPISPVLLFHGVGDNVEEYNLIIEMCKQIILTCDEVWEFGPPTPRGRGRVIEREFAFVKGVSVKQKEPEFFEWFDRRF